MDKELIMQFHEAVKGLHKKKKLDAFDGQLYRSEFFMLITVEEYCEKNGMGIKPSELAQILELSMPAVSKQIKVMEEKGYIERYSCCDDKRVVYIKISLKGQELLDKGKEERNRDVERIIEKMGKDKVKKFIELANEVCSMLECAEKEGK